MNKAFHLVLVLFACCFSAAIYAVEPPTVKDLVATATAQAEKIKPDIQRLIQTMTTATKAGTIAKSDLEKLERTTAEVENAFKDGSAFSKQLDAFMEYVADRRDFYQKKAQQTHDPEWIDIANAFEKKLQAAGNIKEDFITQRSRVASALKFIRNKRAKIIAWMEADQISMALKQLSTVVGKMKVMADALEQVAENVSNKLQREGN